MSTDLDTFAEFRPVEINDSAGIRQYLLRFDNGYGASVITGGSNGPELAVIRWTGDDWDIVYDTPLTSDVILLRKDDLAADLRNLLTQIKNLPCSIPQVTPATTGDFNSEGVQK